MAAWLTFTLLDFHLLLLPGTFHQFLLIFNLGKGKMSIMKQLHYFSIKDWGFVMVLGFFFGLDFFLFGFFFGFLIIKQMLLLSDSCFCSETGHKVWLCFNPGMFITALWSVPPSFSPSLSLQSFGVEKKQEEEGFSKGCFAVKSSALLSYVTFLVGSFMAKTPVLKLVHTGDIMSMPHGVWWLSVTADLQHFPS